MNRINNKLRLRAGFTLIELLVVITIISLLTAVGLAAFSRANLNARDAKRKADMEQLRAALVLYRTDMGSYPLSVTFTSMSPLYPTYTTAASLADPKGTANPYTYTSNGTTFSACATLENLVNGSYQWCVTNP